MLQDLYPLQPEVLCQVSLGRLPWGLQDSAQYKCVKTLLNILSQYHVDEKGARGWATRNSGP